MLQLNVYTNCPNRRTPIACRWAHIGTRLLLHRSFSSRTLVHHPSAFVPWIAKADLPRSYWFCEVHLLANMILQRQMKDKEYNGGGGQTNTLIRISKTYIKGRSWSEQEQQVLERWFILIWKEIGKDVKSVCIFRWRGTDTNRFFGIVRFFLLFKSIYRIYEYV